MPRSQRSSLATPKPPKQLGLTGATAIGLASMIGAGVFVVFREGYAITPAGYFIALALAALVAVLNASSVYRLASEIDRPGGIYAYSRVFISKGASFTAGFSFVLGKIGSIAAIAVVFAEYLAGGNRLVAVLAIAILTAINLAGINRTAAVAAVISGVSILFLLLVFTLGFNLPNYADSPHRQYLLFGNFDAWHILQAASVFFFAFAGYARVATLGTEVRNAKRNIPRAIVIALVAVVALYFATGWQLERVFGQDLHSLETPITKLASSAAPWLPSMLTLLVVALAALGSMLALLAGVSRTLATMAEDAEAPKRLSLRNRFGAPARAEVTIALAACALAMLPDLAWIIGFSSFSVLTYYAIGHLSALRQKKQPAPLSWIGLMLCVLLALCVPGIAVIASCCLLGIALIVRRVAGSS